MKGGPCLRMKSVAKPSFRHGVFLNSSWVACPTNETWVTLGR